MKVLRSYLAGHWVEGLGTGSPLFDPTTGEKIATASTEGLDLRGGLEFARRHGGMALRAMSFAERGHLLAALSSSLHAIRDELIQLSIQNTGTTRSDAKFDVDGGTATLSAYAEIGKGLGDRQYLIDGDLMALGRSPRFAGVHVKVPLRGVAVHINAFNFPIWGLAEKLACAFLAGMPVFSKPATATALPSFRAAEAVVASGVLPNGAWSFLAGSVGPLLDHLLAQDVIAFTGSAETGQRIRAHQNVLRNAIRVNVEADSLNAAVLGEDVDPGSETWALAVREITREMTQKSGQKCTATRRVLVPKTKVEPLLASLREALAEYPVGPPENSGVRVGPLATPHQLADIRRGMERLLTVADLLHGELPTLESAGAFVKPAIFVARESGPSSLVHELEVFGPVTTLIPYDGLAEDAARLVAYGNGGLVATVYSDDLEFVRPLLFELLPWSGRVLLGSAKIAEYSTGPGLVLPNLIHGGPGRAGGGLELGGVRGLNLYLQNAAIQGARPVLERLLSLNPTV